jgi:hypothetical protein
VGGGAECVLPLVQSGLVHVTERNFPTNLQHWQHHEACDRHRNLFVLPGTFLVTLTFRGWIDCSKSSACGGVMGGNVVQFLITLRCVDRAIFVVDLVYPSFVQAKQ